MPGVGRTKPKVPRAYLLAGSRRPTLLLRYNATATRLVRGNRGNVLAEFEAAISRGQAAINMSMSDMLVFLNSGRWLNIYEAVARETGLKDGPLEREVVHRLGSYGEPRLAIDRLFRFRRDTHYASLNLGGAGAQEHGLCSAVFELDPWAPHHTCFAGDTILACFDARGSFVASHDRVLDRFGVGEDVHRLAVVRSEDFLSKQTVCLDPKATRWRLEGTETMIELHLFGRVGRGQISEVRLPRARYEQLCSLVEELHRDPRSTARELDPARAFDQLRIALERHRIRLYIAGDP